MPQVGFEPTIPVVEQAQTFHDLDRAATVIGKSIKMVPNNLEKHAKQKCVYVNHFT
jgi:hypothetical protein